MKQRKEIEADLTQANELVGNMPADARRRADELTDQACLFLDEGRFAAARRFTDEAMKLVGLEPAEV